MMGAQQVDENGQLNGPPVTGFRATEHQRYRATRSLASVATTADELRAVLDMLGLTPGDGKEHQCQLC
jgi:hypothetical protein